MLVLSRKNRESIVIGDPDRLDRHITVTVLEINGNQVKLGIEVERSVPIQRGEIWQRLQFADQGELGDDGLSLEGASQSLHCNGGAKRSPDWSGRGFQGDTRGEQS